LAMIADIAHDLPCISPHSAQSASASPPAGSVSRPELQDVIKHANGC
jgi:hypothetical protein